MRLRTFNAPTMQEAMALVKAELGPEAIILSTEQVGKAVKVTAALDRDAILATPTAAVSLDPMEAITQALDFHRVPGILADRLGQMAENFLLESPQQALAGALRVRFPTQPITERRPPRPIMLVGLPGAGKTATLAKLLARAKLRDWPAIAITCDIFKAGAIEQLGTYAKALQVPAYRANDADMLRRAVAQAPAEALVIIDTVGSNPLEDGDLAQLASLAESVKAEMVLVMAAGGCPVECSELAQLYAETGAHRFVPTRIDAARRLGGILAACEAGKFSFAEFGTSPEIANGLELVTPERLADLILRGVAGPANSMSPLESKRPAAGTRANGIPA